MLSKTKLLLPVLAGAALLFQGCNSIKNDSFYTTADGLSYQIFSKNEKGEYKNKGEVAAGDTSKLGQVIAFHMTIKNSEDSVLVDTRTQKPAFPAMHQFVEPSMKGGFEDALMMLAPGDSGVFKINADSLFAKTYNQPLPAYIKPGSFLTYFIKSEKVMALAEAETYQREMIQEFMNQSLKADDEKIQAYITENNLKDVQKTESGLYYQVTQAGKGPQAAAGDIVSVHYKLTSLTLDGKQLESSYDDPRSGGKPLEFPLGQGQVIPGWDEGIALLNKGSKAVLLVPSSLAYGPQDRGPEMPANSVLRFDVELVDIKKQ